MLSRTPVCFAQAGLTEIPERNRTDFSVYGLSVGARPTYKVRLADAEYDALQREREQVNK